MSSNFLSRFTQDRRAVTAMVMAILAVPMMIAGVTAIDISRVDTVRAALQQAADSAALAGTGAWQTSKDADKAQSAAQAAFDGSASLLPNIVTVSTPTITYTCTGSTSKCDYDGASSPSYATSYSTYSCPTPGSNGEYCVIVTATVTMNDLFGKYLAATDALTVTAGSAATIGQSTVSSSDFTDTSVGTGSDLSGIYAYAITSESDGSTSTSDYTTAPTANSACESGTDNPLGDLPSGDYSSSSSSTTCNYLEIGSSVSGVTYSGSFTLNANDLVGFSFVNFTGGSFGSNVGDLDDVTYPSSYTGSITKSSSASTDLTVANCVSKSVCTHYTSYLYVEKSSAVSYAAYGACSNNSSGAITILSSGGSCGSGTTAVYGYCPAHNLYGSIEAYNIGSTDIVPTEDSIHTYYTAWQPFGYPTTHGSNAAITPFLGPPVYFNKGTVQSSSSSATSIVFPICPQWPALGSNIGVSKSVTPSTSDSGSMDLYVSSALGVTIPSTAETVPVYATYYPDQSYSDGTSADIYPPAVSGCTPVTATYTQGGVSVLASASTSAPWWGWGPNNATADDPDSFWASYKVNGSATDIQNCDNVSVSSTGTLSTTVYPSSAASTSAPFSSAYNNCAFAMQYLGADVTTMPTYWLYTADAGAFSSGSTGNPDSIIDLTAETGSLPTSYTPTVKSLGSGEYTVTEMPSEDETDSLPADTSHHCYNPQANGTSVNYITIASLDGEGSNGQVSVTAGSTNNNDTPVDPVENPQDGIVYCDWTTPPSYGLYWNDMGSWSNPPRYNDDLGYDNAVTDFTCPIPGSGSDGGPSSLF